MVIPFVFALTACGPTSPGNDGERNPEFAQFKTMAQSIIAQYQVDQSGSQGLRLALRNNESIESLIQTNGNKVDTLNSYYAGFLNIAFYTPLAVGDVITNQSGATKFYGLTVKITDGFNGYLQVDKNGNHTYIYAVGFNGDEDYLTYVDINYTNRENYEINGYVASPDDTYFSYIYLDSGLNFKCIEKSNDGYAVTSNGVSHYETKDINTINQICELVVSDGDLQSYKTTASAIADSNQYSITKAQTETALNQYYSYEQTEGDYAIAHGYVVREGVVETANLEDQNFNLKTIILPRTAEVNTIDMNLQFASCVEKVVIPSNIKYVRTEQGKSILNDFYMGKITCDWMDSSIDFVFEEGSTLFKKENNNSYIKVNDDWKIFQLCDSSVFGNETYELNNNGVAFDNITKNVETYFKTYGYPVLKNLALTNSIYDLINAYPNSSDNIELDSLILRNSVAYNEELILNYMNDENIGFGIKKIKELIIDGYYSDFEYDFGTKNNQLVQIDKLSIDENCTSVKVNGYVKSNLTIPGNVISFTSTNGFNLEGNLIVNANRSAVISGISCTGTCTINIPISQNESSYSFDTSGIIASQGIETNYVENLEFDLTGKLSLSGTELTYIAEDSETSLNFANLVTETNGFEYKVFMYDFNEDSLIELTANNIDLTEMAKATLSVVATNLNGLSITYEMFITIGL